MLNDKVRQLLNQIAEIEEELHDTLQLQQQNLFYRLEGSKVKFEEHMREAQKKFKTNIIIWITRSSPRNVITAPVIYSMLIPILLLDLSFAIYQWVCFPLYRVPKVKRNRYVRIDRHQLSYLNSIERLNCIYCGYAGGVLGYCREIAARTEQYWCPIKHAHRILDPHRRYAKFAAFGDAENYHDTVRLMRENMRAEAEL